MPQSESGIDAHSESLLKYSEEIQNRIALVTKQFPITDHAKQNGVPTIEMISE